MRIVYFGTPDFAVPSLNKLIAKGYEVVAVFTQPDRPKGRGHQLQPTPVKQAALSAGIPVYQPSNINSAEGFELVKSFCPDLIVVVAFGQIIKRQLLDLPSLGLVNVHASLLPSYRGAAPIHWAVINGESKTGVTTMYIEEGLDSGNMILKAETPIGENEDTGTLHDRLAELGADLLVDTLDLIAKGQAPSINQDHTLSTYAPMLKKEDELIYWNNSAQLIHNKIRGMHPFPGTYTMFNGKRLKIKKSLVRKSGSVAEPGTIIDIDAEAIWLSTNDGELGLLIVQPEGKSSMSAADFVRGYGIKKGIRLG